MAAAVGVVVVVIAGTRIASVEGFFSDNDRSRWAAARAWLETSSFSLGTRVVVEDLDGLPRFDDRGIVAAPGWVSVDTVLDPATSRFFSSKPPLLSYLVALELALIDVPVSVDERPNAPAVRAALFAFCALPFAVALGCALYFAQRRRLDALSSTWIALAVALGTFLLAFTVTLNNHVPAAGAAALAVALTLHGLTRGFSRASRPSALVALSVAGVAAGFAAALEPPALSLVVALFAVLSVRDAPRAFLFFLVPAAAPLLVHGMTTWIATGDALHFLRDRSAWFHYAGSYWNEPKGADVPDRSVLGYVVEFFAGAHGVFSLTPVFAVGVVGLWRDAFGHGRRLAAGLVAFAVAVVAGRAIELGLELPVVVALLPVLACAALPLALRPSKLRAQTADAALARVALACIAATLGFYAVTTTNHGGIAIGPRWALWLTPLFALGFAPALELARKTTGKARIATLMVLAAALLASMFCAIPRELNPWVPPVLTSASASASASASGSGSASDADGAPR